MIIRRTTSTAADFKGLAVELNNDLHERYGKAQSPYDEHNVIEDGQPAVVGYRDGLPVAIGCLRAIDRDSIEIKRMFVKPAHRRKGFSAQILSVLEKWATELGYSRVRLETGKGQPEAIGLYQKAGYAITANYGPYIGVENSVCMMKSL